MSAPALVVEPLELAPPPMGEGEEQKEKPSKQPKRRWCGESWNRTRLLLGMKPVCDATLEDGTEIDDGAAMYSPELLNSYDSWVLDFVMPRVWGCNKSFLQRMYDVHAGAKHIDVGPGSGYFLERSTFAAAGGKANAQLALLDLSPHCLKFCGDKLAGDFRAVRTYQCDALSPTPAQLPDAPYDSIGMSLLFHCVPGTTLEEKVRKALACLGPSLKAGGVVFGATVLGGGDDIQLGFRQRFWLRGLNSKGIFQNRGDTCDGLCRALDDFATKYSVRVVGNVALFTATLR